MRMWGDPVNLVDPQGENRRPPKDAYDPNGAKAPGLPGPKEGYFPPKGGPRWVPNPNPGRGGSSHGWEDKNGNVWCPTGQGGRAHGVPHWDVQKPGGGYENVKPKPFVWLPALPRLPDFVPETIPEWMWLLLRAIPK